MSHVHRIAWRAGAPARLALIGLIRLYRVTLSGWLGGQCRFYPTCSRYAEDAIRLHGAIRGTLMAAWRIAASSSTAVASAMGVCTAQIKRRRAVAFNWVVHRRFEDPG